MEYREVDVVEYTNNTNTIQNASFLWTKSDILKSNLNQKKIRVRDFWIGNKKLPLFIPKNKTDTNFITNDPRVTTTYTANTTLTPTSLKYYIIIRMADNSASVIYYLRQPQLDPNVAPPADVINDQYLYYTNKYFYYYDLTQWLDVIRNAIIAANNLLTTPPYLAPIFLMTNTQFQLYSQNISSFQYPFNSFLTKAGAYIVEFSPTLHEIFPFKSTLTSIGSYQLNFSDVPVTVSGLQANGTNYYQINCPMYTSIFPFSSLLFTTEDSSLTPESFINNSALLTNNRSGLSELVILRYNLSSNQLATIHDYYEYTNLYNSMWVNFSNDSNLRSNITLNLYLRIKANGMVIPYPLDTDECAKISIETKYEK